MLLELTNARIVDPLHTQNGQTTSLFVRDGKFVSRPQVPVRAQRTLDLGGGLVLSGGIDIHTHIGGGKVNLARMLMAEIFDPADRVVWPSTKTGQKYAQMGYTTCFEPAMLLSTARHTHYELADTPLIDTGAYVVLGNEDWLLASLMQADDAQLQAMIAWSIRATQAMAVKVVNPGGISAFKFNQRTLNVDEPHQRYGVTPREVVRRMAAAVDALGLPHPLHVHASNLGIPGNIRSTLQTLQAAEGSRIHLTHAQFNCYSCEGPYGMGSGSEQLAKYVNSHQNVSLDIGQVLFGQTVTISADTVAQFRNSQHAQPKRWMVSDIECQAGCGIVPMRYQDRQYVHSLQWTIGLELMLLIEDPWRVFLTTDHPNGGPFTCYPHLMRLLMDRSFRQSMLDTIHPLAAQGSLLHELERQYTLDEIAIVTRLAPARILGLKGQGSLCPGASANLAAYNMAADWETTFSRATCVLKDGVEVVREGLVLNEAAVECRTHRAEVDFDTKLLARFQPGLEQMLRMPMHSLEISNDELSNVIARDKQLD